MKLKDSKTYENLAKSFAGECQAHTRYKFIAYGARQEGYIAMADLIDKIVCQEFNHARMFYTKLQQNHKAQIDNISIASGYPFKEKWNLLDNLMLAADDEQNEELRAYPEYMKTARAEGFDDIADLWGYVIEVEKTHKTFFECLYEQMKNGKLYKKDKKVNFVCGSCGHHECLTEAWECCPLCMAKQGEVLLKLDCDNCPC